MPAKTTHSTLNLHGKIDVWKVEIEAPFACGVKNVLSDQRQLLSLAVQRKGFFAGAKGFWKGPLLGCAHFCGIRRILCEYFQVCRFHLGHG